MIAVRKAEERGAAEHGWLSSRHSFSFAGYYDPAHNGFSDLRVINDDRVDPGEGFGTHPHRDMEIFSYVLEGALEHRDSLGHGSVIRPGDVQLISAGRGIAHSEFNASATAPVNFLQIWIVPRFTGIAPRYQQTHVDAAEKRGRLRLILSPDGEDGALRINQDARIYAGLFDGDEAAELNLGAGRAAYVHVARGRLVVNGHALAAGDGLQLTAESALRFGEGHDAEVLVFDLAAPRT